MNHSHQRSPQDLSHDLSHDLPHAAPHSPGRRRVLALAGAAGLGALPWAARAEGYPDRPLRWIVPYAAGGPSDVVARTMAEALGTVLGQKIVIDNKPGGASTLGMQTMLSAPADGYTMITADNATLYNNWYLLPKLSYTPDSFAYVASTGRFPLVLAINKNVPAKNFAEWLAWARANKGTVGCATPGIGTPHHITMASLDDKLGLQLMHVPYKGDSAAIVDLLGGTVPTMLMGVATARQYMSDERMRPIAVTWPTRLNTLPDVPTFDELDVRDFDVPAEQGVLMSAGTPKEIVLRINKDLGQVLADPGLRAKLEVLGMYPVIKTPEEFKAHVAKTAAAAGEIIRRKGITIS